MAEIRASNGLKLQHASETHLPRETDMYVILDNTRIVTFHHLHRRYSSAPNDETEGHDNPHNLLGIMYRE
jgi:hypothetical protein